MSFMKQFYKDDRIKEYDYYEDYEEDNLETHIFIKFVTRDKCKTEARFEPATHTID